MFGFALDAACFLFFFLFLLFVVRDMSPFPSGNEDMPLTLLVAAQVIVMSGSAVLVCL